MAKGEGVAAPMCRNCNEAHWKEPGKVCPKFRSKKVIQQPVPLRLPAPPKTDAPAAPKPKAKKRKKAKRPAKALPPPASAP